jgi:putative endonuclease
VFYLYILLNEKDNKRYVGFSENLKTRINEHNSGSVKSTKNRRPLKLIYFEEYESKGDAIKREKFFKSGLGRSFLKSINK